MKLSGGWGSNKNRARGTRRPKVRWEVLGLQNPLDGRLMTSMEDIRLASIELGERWAQAGTRFPTAERNARHYPCF